MSGGVETSHAIWELAGSETVTYFSTVYNGYMKRGIVGRQQWEQYCLDNRGQLSKFMTKAAAGKIADLPSGWQAKFLAKLDGVQPSLLGKIPDTDYYAGLVVMNQMMAEMFKDVKQQSADEWQTYGDKLQKVSGKLTVTDEGELMVRAAELHRSGLHFNRNLTKVRRGAVTREFADFYYGDNHKLALDLKVKWKDARNRSRSPPFDRFPLYGPSAPTPARSG